MKKKKTSSMLWIHICIAILLVILIGLVIMFGKKIYMQQQIIKQSMQTTNTINSVNFTCDQDKKILANFFNNTVELALSDDRHLLLTQALSGSGVRYTNWDESVTFWNEGDTAFIQEGAEDTETYTNCVESKN